MVAKPLSVAGKRKRLAWESGAEHIDRFELFNVKVEDILLNQLVVKVKAISDTGKFVKFICPLDAETGLFEAEANPSYTCI